MSNIRYLPIVFLLVCSVGCNRDDESPAQGARPSGDQRKFPVELAPVEAKMVVYSLNAVGSVDAFEVVQVTARVPGVVETVRFSEGNSVSQGQTLVEIEPERYRLSLSSAEAAFEKARAALLDAEAGLSRRETVHRNTPGLIPGEELETWRTKVSAAQADLSAAEAAREQAKLNLRDALVKAPLPGIIQTRSAQTGQYAQPGTVLATLLRREPLLLRFRVPEQDASRLSHGLRANFRIRNDETRYTSVISHVAASADEKTRMVQVTARIDDERRAALRPGSFVEVQIPIGETHSSPVIPQTSIRPSERGFLAYVVEGGRAIERVLSLGMRTQDGNVEVLSGLKAGEMLVIRGGEALRDGALVRKSGAKPDGENRAGSGSGNPAAGRK